MAAAWRGGSQRRSADGRTIVGYRSHAGHDEAFAVRINAAVEAPLRFTSIRRVGGTVVVESTGDGTLQEAGSLAGPWLDQPEATSPCTNTLSATGAASFFRLWR
jgi:hypothetical protein